MIGSLDLVNNPHQSTAVLISSALLDSLARDIIDEVLMTPFVTAAERIDTLPQKSFKLLCRACLQVLPNPPPNFLQVIGQLLSPSCPISPKTRKFVRNVTSRYLPDPPRAQYIGKKRATDSQSLANLPVPFVCSNASTKAICIFSSSLIHY